jgi:hypothetical protein
MNDVVGSTVQSGVLVLIDQMYITELQFFVYVFTQYLIVIADKISYGSASLRCGQYTTNDIDVFLRKVPAILKSPSVYDIANKKELVTRMRL